MEIRQGAPVEEKRVYVATDDPTVLEECRRKFPQYVSLGDASISKSASLRTKNATSLLGIIIVDV